MNIYGLEENALFTSTRELAREIYNSSEAFTNERMRILSLEVAANARMHFQSRRKAQKETTRARIEANLYELAEMLGPEDQSELAQLARVTAQSWRK